MAGGLTYGATKDILGTVVENGVSGSDPRVLVRTNEATKAILDETIPVGGMITADVQASGTTLLLPKEFENAIELIGSNWCFLTSALIRSMQLLWKISLWAGSLFSFRSMD